MARLASERVELRMRPDAEQVIREAAALEHVSVSAFLTAAGVERAERVLADMTLRQNASIHATVYSTIFKKSSTRQFSFGAWMLESGRHTPPGDTVGIPSVCATGYIGPVPIIIGYAPAPAVSAT